MLWDCEMAGRAPEPVDDFWEWVEGYLLPEPVDYSDTYEDMTDENE